MLKILCTLFLLVATSYRAYVQQTNGDTTIKTKPVHFIKKQIASESYESVEVFDVNNDQLPDLVSGPFWYEAPHFLKRHYIGAIKQYGEYWDDFSTIAIDVNGDNYKDIVTGGWFGKTLVWKENPKKDAEWKEHLIAMPGNIETTAAWDFDKDGTLEIIANTPNDPLVLYRLKKDNTHGFDSIMVLNEKQGHGLGFGDINGDGRDDIILNKGWLMAPQKPFEQAWAFQKDFNLGDCSIPVIITDLNKDGLNDMIAGQGHDYGLDWYEQKKNAKTKKSTWVKHSIDPFNSQFHAMQWVDVDNDGREELVTGKRFRAHNEKDPGSHDAYGLYYYKWNGSSFTKQIISYGPLGEGKGTGIYFSVHDLRNTGRKDIIVAGKDGLYVFFNEG